MTWIIFLAAAALFVLFWWAVFAIDISASVARDIKLDRRDEQPRGDA